VELGEVWTMTVLGNANVASAATPSTAIHPTLRHTHTAPRPTPTTSSNAKLHYQCLQNSTTSHIMAMDTDTIPNLLGDARDQAPEELQEYFIAFEDYWERKLWHELTDKLIEFYDQPESAKQRIPFFETFIKSFANKINQLKLVTLGLNAATQYKGMRDTFPT
jgi:hypothetical protein